MLFYKMRVNFRKLGLVIGAMFFLCVLITYRWDVLDIIDAWCEKDLEVVENTNTSLVLPVLVIACNRVTVERCLNNLIQYRPSEAMFPIIVSQDCGHAATYEVIKSFTEWDTSITAIQHPDLSDIFLPRKKAHLKGYYKIARHYKFALNHVFETLNHEVVIIVEDDLDIAPDFYEYFLGTYPLLLKDSTLWCVSAWNDNGKKDLIDLNQPELLYRTDFFPGLGWMLQKETWTKLAPNWPQGFYDDWLRDPNNIGAKSCIRPEISRTYSFGRMGVSHGQFFESHLKYIQLNKEYVHFTKLDLTYLIKENYDANLIDVYSLPKTNAEDVVEGLSGYKTAKIVYQDILNYQEIADILGLMSDTRSGIPRTAYRGIVTCYVRGTRVYLVPESKWLRPYYDFVWG